MKVFSNLVKIIMRIYLHCRCKRSVSYNGNDRFLIHMSFNKIRTKRVPENMRSYL